MRDFNVVDGFCSICHSAPNKWLDYMAKEEEMKCAIAAGLVYQQRLHGHAQLTSAHSLGSMMILGSHMSFHVRDTQFDSIQRQGIVVNAADQFYKSSETQIGCQYNTVIEQPLHKFRKPCLCGRRLIGALYFLCALELALCLFLGAGS